LKIAKIPSGERKKQVQHILEVVKMEGMEERFPHKEIEIHRGGQPYSLYILSVE